VRALTRYGVGEIRKEDSGNVIAVLDEPFKGDKEIEIDFGGFFKFSPWAVITVIRVKGTPFAKIEFFESKELAEYELSFSIPEDEGGDVVIFLDLKNGFFKKKGSLKVGNAAWIKVSVEDWKGIEVSNFKKIYQGKKAVRENGARQSDIEASLLLTEIEKRILHFSIISPSPAGVVFHKEFKFNV